MMSEETKRTTEAKTVTYTIEVGLLWWVLLFALIFVLVRAL